MTDGSAPVPGWYEDPKGPGQLRYWDGAQWSEHTQPMPGAVQSAAEAPLAAEQVFPPEDQPGPGYSQESFDYQPETAFGDYSAGTPEPVAEPGSYDAAGSYAEPRGYTEAAGYQGASESLADSAEESAVPPAAAPGFEQPPVSAFGQSPADLESGFGESPTFYAPAAGAVGSTPSQPDQPESGYPSTQAPSEFPPGAPEAPYLPQPGAASGFSAPPQASPPAGQYPPGQYPQGQFPPGQNPQGQFPQGQYPPGQFPQDQFPPGQFPPGQNPQGQFPPGQNPQGQFPPGQNPQSQYPQGQFPQGQYPPGQNPPGQFPPGQNPQGQFPPGQFPPAPGGAGAPGQYPPGFGGGPGVAPQGGPPGAYPQQPAAGFGSAGAAGFAGGAGGPGLGDQYGAQPGMGQPPGTSDKPPVDRNRLLILVGATVVVGIVLLALAYFLLVRSSGSGAETPVPAAVPSLADVENSGEAIQGGACEQLITAMSVNDLPIEISVRLQELAKNENAAGNSTYFANIGTQLTPTRDSFQESCLADIASGQEPATVRSFVNAFDAAVDQGASIGAQIAATNTVDPAQSQALTEAATQLEQANAALPNTPQSDVSTNGSAALVPIPEEPPAQGASAALAALALPANPIDPFAPAVPTPTTTESPGLVDGASVPTAPYDPYGTDPYGSYLSPTPATTPGSDAALAASDNAIDQSRTGSVPSANK